MRGEELSQRISVVEAAIFRWEVGLAEVYSIVGEKMSKLPGGEERMMGREGREMEEG